MKYILKAVLRYEGKTDASVERVIVDADNELDARRVALETAWKKGAFVSWFITIDKKVKNGN
jgi:hypothetical protein